MMSCRLSDASFTWCGLFRQVDRNDRCIGPEYFDNEIAVAMCNDYQVHIQVRVHFPNSPLTPAPVGSIFITRSPARVL